MCAYGCVAVLNVLSTCFLCRCSFNDEFRRSEVTRLHAFHRMTYMGERMVYYEQIALARNEPSNYCSIIFDDMAQSHCVLPWESNLHTSSFAIPQHLQGVLQHGQCANIYRTFGNLGGGRNLAIHCVLLELLDRYEKDGKTLPGVLYLRIDGGPENECK